jgi:hypothetical protein
MWPPRAFNADDPRNMVLADEMGIVMGTSHHEPMTRAHDEWHRFKGGAWDYAKNPAQLREFWRGGIQRMMGRPDGKPFDTLVTVGMRGDGDEPMSEDTATTLLETIVKDQRRIIADVTKQPAEKTPQMWALYKEVQDYYDAGLKVPDDVHLHQRRGARADHLGPEEVRRRQFEDVCACLRAAAAAEGQLPVAGHVAAARLQRRRPEEHGSGRRDGHRDGHLPSRADDAGA